MSSMPTMPAPAAGQQRRKVLLNLKCLFWCLHELEQSYNLNVVLHSIERRSLHPDIADSHLGDNLNYLMETLEEDDLPRIEDALSHTAQSRSWIDVADKHFEIGHYVQALKSFGPIAEDSYGIISSITPELRGLFCVDGIHLMESAFAPSDVRVIFGTYVC